MSGTEPQPENQSAAAAVELAPAAASPGLAAAARGELSARHIGPGGRAGSSWRAWAVMLLVCAATLALDLWTKSWAFETIAGAPVVVDREVVLRIAEVNPRDIGRIIPPHRAMVVVPHVLEFSLVVNPGAVFGMGPGQRWFFMTFTLFAVVVATWMFARWCGARDWLSHAAIGMLISGGIGNFYDRMVHGCVRDFIHPLPNVTWPFGWAPFGSTQVWPYVSNVADAFLIVGIGILAWRLWRVDAGAGAAEPRRGIEASASGASRG